MAEKTNKQQITELLHTKSCIKQDIYNLTKEVFSNFKTHLKNKERELESELDANCRKNVDLEYKEKGDYLVELKFASDVLVFSMHTNIFDFEKNHYLHKNSYVKQNKYNAYCGIINVYNFIADSFKYNRYEDSGFLIARIFINKDKHFFVEGKKELGVKYNNFESDIINEKSIEDIIEICILHAIKFDLRTPPFQHVSVVSVETMMDAHNNLNLATSKRLGFKFKSEQNKAVK